MLQPSLTLQPALIIFDCDGVLVDTETLSNQVLVDNLGRYGLSLTLADCMDLFVGGTMIGVKKTAQQRGAVLPENWIEEIYAEIYTVLRSGVDSIAGIPDVLDLLDAADIPYCVASNGSEEKMHITLGQTGLLARFENVMFSAHTLGTSKPDPELFLAAAAHFSVAPADCVVIEDSLNGVQAAVRANMRCYAFCTGHQCEKLRAAGGHVFHEMSQLHQLLSL